MKRIASFFLALALAFSFTACTVPVEKADDGKIQIRSEEHTSELQSPC